MKQTSREIAVSMLGAFRKSGAWSDGYLKKAIRAAELDRRDAALAAMLTYGVLQNMALCDFYISAYSSIKMNKISPRILDILRVGVFQILFLDRIPAHAAVNESVHMARRDNPRASGFVNAVLRKIISSKDSLPCPKGSDSYVLSVRYSHPEWLVTRLIQLYGVAETREILAENNRSPLISARVNSCITTVEETLQALREQDVTAEIHPWLSNCVMLSGTGDIERLNAYQNGFITVCDPASQLAAFATGVHSGQKVLDSCAAPGGKTFLMAQMMENRGKIIACDIHDHKLDIINSGTKRLKLDIIDTCQKDASLFDANFGEEFDVVLADVPCSGLGIIRKKPEIRYKDEQSIAGLPRIQSEILQNVSRYVRPGGVLVYSTCTILPNENDAVVDAFLEAHPDFVYESFQLPGDIGCVDGKITLLPHIHGTDGFFISKLRRNR